MEPFDFTAIDFETMTAEHTSACAIGIVRVENSVIVQKFFSLIKPIPDSREKTNTYVHGITPEMVANSPTFKELWPIIQPYINGRSVVCHNEDFDIDVLKKLANHYDIHFQCKVYDTMKMTEMSLHDACDMENISLEDHHDALCDATACAKLMLKCMGITLVEHHYEKLSTASRKKRALSKESKVPLRNEEVEDKSTPFFNKKVVLTGIIDTYPLREELAQLLKKYGADINSSISKVTDFVIVGHGFGPSKMKKVESLNAEGANIRVIYEPELLEIIEKFNIH